MDWDWAVGGVTDEVPRTMGPECENYLTNRRRWTEAVLFCSLFTCILLWAVKRLEPIKLPDANKMDRPHSTTRLVLLLIMTFTFGIEMGFKLANRSVIFTLNPCHIQTLVQIYLLAAKPTKLTTILFRIQMNNLNGPFLAFLFPEVECRTLPFEQATYWIQHGMLYIIPAYILRTGAYQVEDIKDYNWAIIGVQTQLIYHFGVLNFVSIRAGINLNHMLCAAESDPFQGDNYRIAAVIHESFLCPLLNKITVLIFSTPDSIQLYEEERAQISQEIENPRHHHHHQQQQQQQQYTKLTTTTINPQQLPPIIETAYYSDNRSLPTTTTSATLTPTKTTTQLRHRKSVSLEYQQYHNLPQHQRQLLQQHEENKEAVRLKGECLLAPDDLGREVMDPAQTAAATATTTVEFTMPTTKID